MHTRRIARGARWLDENYSPEWAGLIRIEDLNPDSDEKCVIGQIEGSFELLMERRYRLTTAIWDRLHPRFEFVGYLLPGTWLALLWAFSHGFVVARESDYMWRLAWEREIRDRQKLYVPIRWTTSSSSIKELAQG